MTATMQPHPPLSALWSVSLAQAHPALAASVSSHLSTCDHCRHRYQDLCSDVALLTLALEPSPLPALLRESILQAAGEIHRLFDAALPLARALRIGRRAAHGILLRLDAPRYWQQEGDRWLLPLPESRLRNARIVRLHTGETLEVAVAGRGGRRKARLLLILQGAAKDAGGHTYQATMPVDEAAPHSRPLMPRSPLLVQPGADFLALVADSAPPKAQSLQAISMVTSALQSAESLN